MDVKVIILIFRVRCGSSSETYDTRSRLLPASIEFKSWSTQCIIIDFFIVLPCFFITSVNVGNNSGIGDGL